MTDRISDAQISRLTAGRPRPAGRAIEIAARAANGTEQAIRDDIMMIRAKLTEIEQRLDRGLPLDVYGELRAMPASLDHSITLRQGHLQVLEALLTEAELAALHAPPSPAGRQAAATGAAHGRDAARRALAHASPDDCLDLIIVLDSGGSRPAREMYPAPALGGEHGISYSTADLAAGLRLPADSPDLARTYRTAADRAFWAEAGTIARDRGLQASRAGLT